MGGVHNPKVKHKSSFGAPPRKGTKLRNVALLLLRGTSRRELRSLYGYSYLSSALVQLCDQKGYDVREFPMGGMQIVGKFSWDGTYRSFVNDRYTE